MSCRGQVRVLSLGHWRPLALCHGDHHQLVQASSRRTTRICDRDTVTGGGGISKCAAEGSDVLRVRQEQETKQDPAQVQDEVASCILQPARKHDVPPSLSATMFCICVPRGHRATTTVKPQPPARVPRTRERCHWPARYLRRDLWPASSSADTRGASGSDSRIASSPKRATRHAPPAPAIMAYDPSVGAGRENRSSCAGRNTEQRDTVLTHRGALRTRRSPLG